MKIYLFLATLLLPLFAVGQSTCDNAIEAVEGSNVVPASGSYYWYKYTMPNSGRVRANSANYSNMRFYYSCQNDNGEYNNDGNDIVIEFFNGNFATENIILRK